MKCQNYLFTFLYDPEVPYDNNGSERAVRKINVFVKQEQRKLACSAERRKGRMKSNDFVKP